MRSMICAVHKHYNLVPVESHHIWPLGYHGPNILSNRVQVCANGHSDTHYLLEHMLKTGNVIPWNEKATYGPRTRELARLGYNQVMAYAESLTV